jgi:gluconate 2-dehydrogenase gamma chain
MANQSPDRRHVLEMLALATVAGRYRGFSRWVCAPQHAMEDSVHPRPHTYTPQFFNAAEFKTLDELTEQIIPRDDTPGAHDAGVAEFIDFMAAADTTLQQTFRDGLAPFAGLSPAQQTERLRAMLHDKFFSLLRRYTVMGYYTTRIGLEQLDYPGLKLYSASPGCQHPEHQKSHA